MGFIYLRMQVDRQREKQRKENRVANFLSFKNFKYGRDVEKRRKKLAKHFVSKMEISERKLDSSNKDFS